MRSFYVISFSIWLLYVNTSFASDQKSTDEIYIAIPIDESILRHNDPYFVMLERALVGLNVEVLFVEMPGGRSFKQLKEGQIAGSYPRYEFLAQKHNEVLPIKSFNRPNPLYVYSLKDVSDSTFTFDYFNRSEPVGAIRGTLLLESLIETDGVYWFSHIDHLVGAIKLGRITYMIESPRAMNRFLKTSKKTLYRSKEHLLEGKVTLLMHQKYEKLVSRLDAHFKINAPF